MLLPFVNGTVLLTIECFLLSQTETSRETVESTYDRFLAEFPLCFGYWNKVRQYEEY